MEITASVVKELRERTGLGMMICKQALQESNGDMNVAIENLRKQGQMTAAKRAGKAAKEGCISIVSDASSAILYEVNTETDFVARNDDFIAFVDVLGKLLLSKKPETLEEAKALVSPELGNISVDARVTELVGKIGEIISFRRYRKINADPNSQMLATYIHGKGKIGVVVKINIDKKELIGNESIASVAKDLTLQVAAANPLAVDRNSIAADVIAKEKDIYYTQAQTSGKPEKIWDKIVEGKLVKFYQEMTLIEQPFIRDTATTVSDRVAAVEKETGARITVDSFVRLELGAEE